jgi:hypothetical protein
LNRSFTGSLILDVARAEVVHVSSAPVLQPGQLGEFDDSGAMGSWLSRSGSRVLMYYIGWNLGVTVPFRNAIGVASPVADGRWQRVFSGPIVDRTRDEPHFCASCCVLEEHGLWRMWYLACSGWDQHAGAAPRHKYHIRYAESDDGIEWRRNGIVAIDFADAGEYAISRPCVIRDQGWSMWYSHRGAAYRIGFATSDDGVHWTRRDAEAGIDVSESGWDCDMVEYPFVFAHSGQKMMLYNGNGYGRTGFGLAVLEGGAP